MTAVYIWLALAAVIIIFDYISATKPDPKDKYKRRRPLSPTDAKQLRDLVFGAGVGAVVIYFLAKNWFN